jgi:hypothetical protein
MHADMDASCTVFDIRVAGFRVKRALCQEAVWLGWVVFRRTHGSRPSGVVVMRQDCNYQLDTMKSGIKWGTIKEKKEIDV